MTPVATLEAILWWGTELVEFEAFLQQQRKSKLLQI